MKKLISVLMAVALLICPMMPMSAMAYEKDYLKETLTVGSSGEVVSAAQELLSTYGYYTGAQDGVYSDTVKKAVIRFQRANSLTVDGKLGKKTWAKLIGNKVVPSDKAPSDGNYDQEQLRRIMKEGCEGNDVSNAQERLAVYGYYTGNITGKYSNKVKQAVLAFQRANDLKADGKIGPNTWEKLISDSAVKKEDAPASNRIEYGDTGDVVKKAQERLYFYGYYNGENNGKFGDTLKQAVLKFQRRNGLEEDGIIGDKTWAILNTDTGVKFSDPGFERIEQGMTGIKVETVQQALKDYYYYTDKIDGIFDLDVTKAVKLFQTSEGLTVDGIVGEKTWNALVYGNARIFNGGIPGRGLSATARGYDVYVLQLRLIDLNFLKPATFTRGYYDETTVKAMKSFQKANKLEETGKLDSATRRHLWPSDTDAEEEATVESIDDLPKLRKGRTGSVVANVQMRLKSGGYLLGKADGIFGEQTEKAVKVLQKHYGLNPDGVIGEDTWAVLSSFDVSYADPEVVDTDKAAVSVSTRKLKVGRSGSDVKKLQQQLINLGYLASGEDDGYFGPITETAVKDFQTAKGLKVDGIAGTNTFVAIYEDLGNPI